ncbi:MAG: hypothetical protein ACRC1P_10135 [Cellulosilyticaceae bacterium]
MSTLSPPWYTLYNEILYTVGLTPNVCVGELAPLPNGSYTLPIRVSSCLVQAEALRLIIPETFTFGGVTVTTQIFLNTQFIPVPALAITSVEQVATLFCNALYMNPLFIGTVLLSGKLPPEQQGLLGDVSIIICPQVIQFYNDNLADLCSNFNGVATNVFASVLQSTFGTTPIKVSFSTFDPNCTLQQQRFCPTCQ